MRIAQSVMNVLIAMALNAPEQPVAPVCHGFVSRASESSPPKPQPASQPATSTAPRGRAEFAAGVVIDWNELQVELEGKVVLQAGPLELAVCSPHTREHESIIVVQARPLDVYNALGLIGLTPGRPFTYDEKNQRWLAPQGDLVQIRVQYLDQGTPRSVDLWTWMIDAETGKPAEPRDWVFCGSRRFPDGTFGADADGTVVCVVDFDTALIGLADPHSADNAALWVQANPKTVPPEGTPCTLLLRASPATKSKPAERGRG